MSTLNNQAVTAKLCKGSVKEQKGVREETTLKRPQLDRFLADVERRALRIALFSVKDTDDAMDVVQEAMLAFVKNYQHKPETQWKPLFYRVLDSKMMDFHRRAQVRRRWRVWLDKSLNDDDEPLDSSHQAYIDPLARDGEQTLDTQQQLATFERALQALPDRQRQAFLLRQWEGLSTRDTAAAMKCAEGSVKTHYSRALNECAHERLQAQLQLLQFFCMQLLYPCL